jgi:hypothetical protein
MTGEGQHVDLSQMVASVPLNGPALLDFTVNGRGSRRPVDRDNRRLADFPKDGRPEAHPAVTATRPEVLKTASVKGFGCRPVVTYAAVLRAGVRKPPRKEPEGAEWPRRVEFR